MGCMEPVWACQVGQEKGPWSLVLVTLVACDASESESESDASESLVSSEVLVLVAVQLAGLKRPRKAPEGKIEGMKRRRHETKEGMQLEWMNILLGGPTFYIQGSEQERLKRIVNPS